MSPPGTTDTNEDGIGLRSSAGAYEHFFNKKETHMQSSSMWISGKKGSLVENYSPTLK